MSRGPGGRQIWWREHGGERWSVAVAREGRRLSLASAGVGLGESWLNVALMSDGPGVWTWLLARAPEPRAAAVIARPEPHAASPVTSEVMYT